MSTILKKIGVMQGRLSPMHNGIIQSFPWGDWQDEFRIANELNVNLLEWTLDFDTVFVNPILNNKLTNQIINLKEKYKINIDSLTGDCFMQCPFWKTSGSYQKKLIDHFYSVIEGCCRVGIKIIVIPLVDNGTIENENQSEILNRVLNSANDNMRASNLKIAFESDMSPAILKEFICRYDPELYGINYDIGNSASLGFRPAEEFASYGDRIINVHVKDRKYLGPTVDLGCGDADFKLVNDLLNEIKYKGNFILQTYRGSTDDNVIKINDNLKFLKNKLA